MEYFIYINNKFVDRISEAPIERIEACFNAKFEKEEVFNDPICGESVNIYLSKSSN